MPADAVPVTTATVEPSIIAGMSPHAEGKAQPQASTRGEDVPIRLVLGGGSLIHRVSRELRTALEAQLAPFGVTAQQAGLLLRSARQEISPNQLAPLLGTDTAGMTRLLDRLEDKGSSSAGGIRRTGARSSSD
jgi:hypothetical protein